MKRLIFIFALLLLFANSEGQIIRAQPFARAQVVASSYCDEFQAVYDAMTTPPDAEHSALYNTFVESAIDHGYWSDLDWMSIFAVPTNDASEALINWINPGTNNPALVGATAFVAYQGFTGDGAATGITSSWSPNNDGVKWSINSASFGAYIRNDVQEDKFVIGATNDGNTADNIQLRPRNTGNAINALINSNGIGSVANASSTGFYMVNRTASDATSIWRNGGSIDTDTDASTEETTRDLGILFRQAATRAYWSTNQVSMVYFGGAMTDQEKIDFNTDFEVLMDALGTGVE